MFGRVRAGAIIIRDGRVLLMFRRRKGREYYIIPGGTKGWLESPRAAAVREVLEETGLAIKIDRELFTETNYWARHFYYLAHPVEGEPVLGGEEAGFHSEKDFYRLDWISLEELSQVNLIAPSTKALLLQALEKNSIK